MDERIKELLERLQALPAPYMMRYEEEEEFYYLQHEADNLLKGKPKEVKET